MRPTVYYTRRRDGQTWLVVRADGDRNIALTREEARAVRNRLNAVLGHLGNIDAAEKRGGAA